MRFFIKKKDILGNEVHITGDDCVHLGISLRAKTGKKITVCDEEQREYECVISSITQEKIIAVIEDMHSSVIEPAVKIHLYQSVAKGDKLDLVVQKATEIGAESITLVHSKRCIARYDDKSSEKKTQRLCKIAESAAKQSGRGIIPVVNPPVSFGDAIKSAKGLKLFCYELENSLSIKEALVNNRFEEVSVFVGPEGGYTEEEAQQAVECGACAVTLGKRILRCETAPIFALSCLVYQTEL